MIGQAVVSGQAEGGVLVFGSGADISVAAGKVVGIRAATIHDHYTAHQGVEHDGVNVLCLGVRVIGPEEGAEVIGPEEGAEIVTAFLGETVSDEERQARRRAEVDAIERTSGQSDEPLERSTP